MCSIPGIRLLVKVFNWVKGAFSIYVFAIGCFLAASTDFKQAFGVQFINYGLSLIFLALLSLGLIWPFKYGVERHNRFLIAFSFVMETIIFAELIHYGVLISSYTVPRFSKSLQLDCLRNTPIIYTPEQCTEFYESDRTAGFRLVWQSYFTKINDKKAFQTLTFIGEGLCCGFYQPFKCTPNPDKFPSSRAKDGISGRFLKARVTCSPGFPNYYPRQPNCAHVADFSTDPPTIGGCEYDLGAGACLDKDVESSTYGCASGVEDFVVTQIAPHAILLVVCSIFHFLYMVFACCMWWKRKEPDVFPSFLAGNKVRKFLHLCACCVLL